MNKHFKHILTVLTIVIFAGLLYATSAQAEPGITTVKFGKTYKINRSDENDYYKFTVPKDGIVEINNKGGESFEIYNKIKKDDGSSDEYVLSGDSKYISGGSTYYLFMKKGTYYFTLGYYFEGSFKINYYKKPTNKPNYCMKKAVSLPKNKQIFMIQQEGKRYDRWYKIKLTKKKSITYISNHEREYNIFLFNSKGKYIKTIGDSEDNSIRYTSKRLKKGTYYFKVSYTTDFDGSFNYDSTEIFTLKWK